MSSIVQCPMCRRWCVTEAELMAHFRGNHGGPGPLTRFRLWVSRLARQITLERGLTGAKPQSFVWWVLAALNVQRNDEFVDLFPGSGAVARAWESWRNQAPLGLVG